MNHVDELVRILARLRAPDGCPWDREQTHASLKEYLVEEAGELLDAIDDADADAMADELGDVLLQVVFHSQIAAEAGHFDLQDVARRCCEKMRRRHPHVFQDASVHDAAGVLTQWEQIKSTENIAGARTSAVSGVPRHLPALHRAQKIQKRAAKIGFDWPTVAGVLEKIEEELGEVRHAIASGKRDDIAEEIGDLLFAVVNLSRCQQCHAEELLHQTVKKFERRFRKMEALLRNDGASPEHCTLDRLDAAWNRAKAEETSTN